jgi:hypothetical protein
MLPLTLLACAAMVTGWTVVLQNYSLPDCQGESSLSRYETNHCYSTGGGSYVLTLSQPVLAIDEFPLATKCDRVPIITNFYLEGKCYRNLRFSWHKAEKASRHQKIKKN